LRVATRGDSEAGHLMPLSLFENNDEEKHCSTFLPQQASTSDEAAKYTKQTS